MQLVDVGRPLKKHVHDASIINTPEYLVACIVCIHISLACHVPGKPCTIHIYIWYHGTRYGFILHFNGFFRFFVSYDTSCFVDPFTATTNVASAVRPKKLRRVVQKLWDVIHWINWVVGGGCIFMKWGRPLLTLGQEIRSIWWCFMCMYVMLCCRAVTPLFATALLMSCFCSRIRPPVSRPCHDWWCIWCLMFIWCFDTALCADTTLLCVVRRALCSRWKIPHVPVCTRYYIIYYYNVQYLVKYIAYACAAPIHSIPVAYDATSHILNLPTIHRKKDYQ